MPMKTRQCMPPPHGAIGLGHSPCKLHRSLSLFACSHLRAWSIVWLKDSGVCRAANDCLVDCNAPMLFAGLHKAPAASCVRSHTRTTQG